MLKSAFELLVLPLGIQIGIQVGIDKQAAVRVGPDTEEREGKV